MAILPGHPLWGAQADAALARVYRARGFVEQAAEAGRAALAALDAAMTEDLYLDILLPAGEAVLAAPNDGEEAAIRDKLGLTLALLAQHFRKVLAIVEGLRRGHRRHRGGEQQKQLRQLHGRMPPGLVKF